MQTFRLGSISTGTLRRVDLIPTFADFLAEHGDESDRHFLTSNHDVIELARDADNDLDYAIQVAEETGDDEYAEWTLAELIDRLDGIAPSGHRFGAHEGDGADYGFWPVSE